MTTEPSKPGNATNPDARADWCVSDGGFAMSGTRMREHSRTVDGETRWCFRCRKRVGFTRVVTVPDGLSYYGPNVWIECAEQHHDDGDLFPGYTREWEDA